jgi:HAD domain in Swiss Army Knife RNA repair proteins
MEAITLILDFDGVLNNEPFLRQEKNTGGTRLFDPVNIESLNLLCTSLAIESIVVSSSWREGRTVEQLRSLLVQIHFAHSQLMVATTGPAIGVGHDGRAKEISAWMATTSRHRVVVLDDYNLPDIPGAMCFQINAQQGLTKAKTEHISNVCTLHWADGVNGNERNA